jgi:hypothetical protein
MKECSDWTWRLSAVRKGGFGDSFQGWGGRLCRVGVCQSLKVSGKVESSLSDWNFLALWPWTNDLRFSNFAR